ncbi:AAA family ATPase, partial [Acinetobacter baumannii]|uniref:AAA family ATPase n=1 Tax=Acinetobacter baumannii TaxID=470 RepID=UPI001C083122
MEDVLAGIAEVEDADGYRLTERQREAVFMAVSCPLSVITGGAGSGKTTVVKAILTCLERRARTTSLTRDEGLVHRQLAIA